jgi:hypothetical protein
MNDGFGFLLGVLFLLGIAWGIIKNHNKKPILNIAGTYKQWNYRTDGGYYRIYDSAQEMVGIDNLLGSGELPEFS